MPNNRGPSKGCRRCRELKVKCDESKPSCHRCRKGTYDCVYQSQFDLFHRDQNTFAQTTATKKWRQRAEIKPTVHLTDMTIPRTLSPHLSEAAYNRLYYDFVIPWPGTLSRLRQQLHEASPDSCLVSVVAAVAYANFHGRCYSPEAKRASGVHYGLALQRLASTMTDAVEMQRDEILMVIWLLAMYEMLTSDKRDGSWITHVQGTQSVIAHRDKKRLKDDDHYLAILCMNMVIYYLAEVRSPPAHLRYWIYQIPFLEDFKKQLVATMAEAATACANLRERSICRATHTTEELISTDIMLIQEALAVDLKLQSWGNSLPPDWAHRSSHPLTNENRPSWIRELLASPGAPEYSTRYSNNLAACDWISCNAARIRLHQEILWLISTFSSPIHALNTIKSQSLDVLLTLTDEIASSVPYALTISADGTSDPATPDKIPGLFAFRILWPMFTSLVCLENDLVRGRDLAQRAQWFQTILRFLRDTMGIAKVDVFLNVQREIPRGVLVREKS